MLECSAALPFSDTDDAGDGGMFTPSWAGNMSKWCLRQTPKCLAPLRAVSSANLDPCERIQLPTIYTMTRHGVDPVMTVPGGVHCSALESVTFSLLLSDRSLAPEQAPRGF